MILKLEILVFFCMISLLICSEAYKNNFARHCMQTSRHGVQTILLHDDSQPFQVFCDQESYFGGWTVVLNRYNDEVDFTNHTWRGFKVGFGNLTGQHFIGLDILNAITKVENYMVLIVMKDFMNKTHISSYDTFEIWDQKYRFSTGDTMLAHSGVDVGFTKFNAFCVPGEDVICENDVPGWQLNPTLEPEVKVKSFVQFFGEYPIKISNMKNMGIYYTDTNVLHPLLSIKMMIRPFAVPETYKKLIPMCQQLDNRFFVRKICYD